MSASDEVPFLSGMEREPVCEKTISVGKKLFTLDGMVDRLLGKARDAMESRAADRGPDPDAPDGDEERILIPVRLLDRLGNNYQEAPRPPRESNLKAIVIGCTITIVSAGVIGAIVLSNQFSALRAEFSEWKTATEHRLEQLERRP